MQKFRYTLSQSYNNCLLPLSKILVCCWLTFLIGLTHTYSGGDFEDPNPSMTKLQPDPQLQHWILQLSSEALNGDQLSEELLEELELMKIQAPAMYKYHEANHNMYSDMANEGHADVMSLLASNFHFGRGVQVNPVKALRWFLHAAEKGNLQAQITSGLFFLHGIGLQSDLQQAAYWLTKASDQGSALALKILHNSNLVRSDESVGYPHAELDIQNPLATEVSIPSTSSEDLVTYNENADTDLTSIKTASDLLPESNAEEFSEEIQIQNLSRNSEFESEDEPSRRIITDPETLVELADSYFTGNSGPQNVKKALQLYEQAAEQNSIEAQLKLGLIFVESMTGVEGHKAKGLSLLQKAAERGSLEAQKIYAEELLKKKQVQTAALYLEKAAQQGDVDSMISLAELSKEQSSLLQNIDSAYWYLQAALKGNHEAQFIAGMLYVDGVLIPQDFRLAYRWLLLAGQKGHKEAQFQLGVLYSKGLGVPKNDYRAAKWYGKSAQQGHRDAAAILGTLYYDGKGVSRDFEQALHWFTQAARSGDMEIQELLVKLYKGQMQVPPDYIKAYAWANVLAQKHDSHRHEADYLQTYLSAEELRDAQELSLDHFATIQKRKLVAN